MALSSTRISKLKTRKKIPDARKISLETICHARNRVPKSPKPGDLDLPPTYLYIGVFTHKITAL